MATEKLPESASISLENYVASEGTIISYSGQEDLSPASNLPLLDRTQRWWTPDSTSSGWVIADLREPVLSELFALPDSNLNSGETVTLEGSDNALRPSEAGAFGYEGCLVRARDLGRAGERSRVPRTRPAVLRGSVSRPSLFRVPCWLRAINGLGKRKRTGNSAGL